MKPRSEYLVLFNIAAWITATITGIFVGFICKKMLKISAAILGAIGGFFVGMALYSLVFSSWWHNNIFQIVLSVFVALVFALISFWFYDIIVILSTAMIGSYSFIRGISLFAGGYPNEADFIKSLRGTKDLDVDWQLYVYLSSVFVLFLIGVGVQLKLKAKEDESNYVKSE